MIVRFRRGGSGCLRSLIASVQGASEEAAAEKKKTKSGLKVSLGLGVLGRAVSKRLKPGTAGGSGGGKRGDRRPADTEIRQRRKQSICSATQNTRLSCLTDEMLMDHTQVNNTPSHHYHYRRHRHVFI